MKRFLPVVVLASLVWAGCGGGSSSSSSSTTVAVTISPTTASIAGGATQQFTATVTGSTNTSVTWGVNGEAGGDAIIGTVSTTGLYTAPTKLPSSTTVTVTATSVADTTKAAPAVVTLTAPTVTISIAPTSAPVPAGGTQQFTPTVTSTDNDTAVTWSVSGCAAVPANCGTVDSKGLYTAPLSPPNEAITVTATSVADAAFTASAPITVLFGNATLNGNYVFLAEQADNSSGSGFAFRGGVFTADGNGHITGGVTDSNSAAGPLQNVSLSPGTYSVGPDGLGTATLVDANGSHTFSFALASSTRGQLIQFDSSAVASGILRKQDQTAIGSVSGPFVFSLFGDNTGPFAAVGQLSFANGAISGTVDANNVGSVATQVGIAGGSFSVGASGRGTATIPGVVGTSNFAFYIIDSSDLIFVDLDSAGARTAGTAYAQSTASFSNSSLGSSVYFVSGNTVSGTKPYAQAGRFDTNGSGGAFGGGVFDINSAGTPTNASFASGANYNVSSIGRFQIPTGTSTLIAWLASPSLGVVMQADSTAVATGLLIQQQTPFQSITGGFEFVVAGASADGTAPQAINAQLTTGGFGVLSGTEDVNIAGALTMGATISGNLTIGTNGRGTSTHNVTGTINGSAIVTSNSYSFYFANPNRFILLTTDSKVVLSGIAERQCSDCTF